jgi:hypothetical protein
MSSLEPQRGRLQGFLNTGEVDVVEAACRRVLGQAGVGVVDNTTEEGERAVLNVRIVSAVPLDSNTIARTEMDILKGEAERVKETDIRAKLSK